MPEPPKGDKRGELPKGEKRGELPKGDKRGEPLGGGDPSGCGNQTAALQILQRAADLCGFLVVAVVAPIGGGATSSPCSSDGSPRQLAIAEIRRKADFGEQLQTPVPDASVTTAPEPADTGPSAPAAVAGGAGARRPDPLPPFPAGRAAIKKPVASRTSRTRPARR